MRAISAFTLLLMLVALIGRDTVAQTPAEPPASQMNTEPLVSRAPAPGELVPGPTVRFEEGELPRGVPDSLFSEHRVPRPDSARFLADAHRSALEAAEMDPGIVIFPDVSMNARIIQIEPPENVDPHMMIPREPGRFEGLQHQP